MPVAVDLEVTRFVRDTLGLADKRTGSAVISLAAVILGESDLYLGFGEHIWDVAACAVLAEAAGLAHTIDWHQKPATDPMSFFCGLPARVERLPDHWVAFRTT